MSSRKKPPGRIDTRPRGSPQPSHEGDRHRKGAKHIKASARTKRGQNRAAHSPNSRGNKGKMDR